MEFQVSLYANAKSKRLAARQIFSSPSNTWQLEQQRLSQKSTSELPKESCPKFYIGRICNFSLGKGLIGVPIIGLKFYGVVAAPATSPASPDDPGEIKSFSPSAIAIPSPLL